MSFEFAKCWLGGLGMIGGKIDADTYGIAGTADECSDGPGLGERLKDCF
jgi:hypothetical protein